MFLTIFSDSNLGVSKSRSVGGTAIWYGEYESYIGRTIIEATRQWAYIFRMYCCYLCPW